MTNPPAPATNTANNKPIIHDLHMHLFNHGGDSFDIQLKGGAIERTLSTTNNGGGGEEGVMAQIKQLKELIMEVSKENRDHADQVHTHLFGPSQIPP